MIELTVFFVGSWQALQDGSRARALVENPVRIQVFDRIAFKPYPVHGAVEAAEGMIGRDSCLERIRDGDVGSDPDLSRSREGKRCVALAGTLSGIGRWSVLGQFDLRGVLPSVFLHAHVAHAALNLVAFIVLAPLVARRFGPARFLVFFCACGIAGNALYWLITGLGWALLPPLGLRLPFLPVVGVSGAVFGLIAVHIGQAFRTARARRDPTILGLTPRHWRSVFWILVWHIFFAVSNAPVAWEAHLGGLLMGFALAPFMFRTPSAHRAYFRKVRRRLSG